ncbi:hypothetical protein GCM10025868_23910 [Angustibacter aerolatus]|uniref:alanine transaminase n=1 Tax=Angustibacter aerolatus TaxID=1162965 RepID=A0ABQ6JK12_9ACTN|nr:aminotransferase class I/II-fold pyridoxal phosphate-dependent enzyme [Angustibacter aerolatus]GMA87141.1 hypothetical protein GCM10025868_23910 [Angustibacter aerolatus]
MSLQALLDDGDEVLIPAPDYPLWTAAVSLAGGRPVHYRCDEASGWQPDVEHLRAQVGPRTKAVVVINPNNPTGAVYGDEVLGRLLDVAREHDLVVLSDEIYEQILFDDATHTATASLAPDLLCLTFNGLSKAYRLAGFRSGWMTVSGLPATSGEARSLRRGPRHPRQHAAVPQRAGAARGGDGARRPARAGRACCCPADGCASSATPVSSLLREIPGVACTTPQGALYLFPRLDPDVYDVQDDQALVLDLLREQHLLLVQGTGFNWPEPDHLRIVTLPHVETLRDAMGRLAEFLEGRRTRG